MKICPQCSIPYKDDMSFCLEDGTTLVAAKIIPDTEKKTVELPKGAIPKSDSHLSQETEIRKINKSPGLINQIETLETRQQIEPKDKKSRSGFMVGILVLVGSLLFGTAIGVGYLFMKDQGGTETALTNSNKAESNVSIKDTNIKAETGTSEFDEENSKINANLLENKETAKTSPTKDQKETPNPTATKTPTNPTATPNYTPTPTPKPTQKPTPAPTQTPPKGATSDVKILSKPQPRMTVIARKNNTQGVVVLQVTFLANGQIGNISPVKRLPHGLTQSAIAAAKRIGFTPAMKNGTPYSVTKQIAYRFTIY